jgi:hypothetical protein
MTIRSKKGTDWVVVMLQSKYEFMGRFDVMTKEEAQTMIAQFRDVMEDFYRTWPELMGENKNDPI